MKHAPGRFMFAYRQLGEAWGQEFESLSRDDAVLVARDYLDAVEGDCDSAEYRRRIGRGNLQAYADCMQVRAKRGW